jgi:hypothetical protein
MKETDLPSPNMTPSVLYDDELIYVIIIVALLVVGGIVGMIIFAVKRRK